MRLNRLLLALLTLFSLLLLMQGKTPFWQLVRSLSDAAWNPLRDERMPRLIILLASGASLAVSGAMMQALFVNPLASPAILGVSSGGSLAVTLIFLSGFQLTAPYLIPLSAIAGCLAALALVYSFAKVRGRIALPTLLLSGIAFSTVLSALQGALLYAFRDHWQLVQTLAEWGAGSSWDRSWQQVHFQLPLSLIGLACCWKNRKELDILMLGEEEAANLGVEVKEVRLQLFVSVALLCGGALAALGLIPFFGLMIPHTARALGGLKHQSLLPRCALLGSLSLLMMDYSLRALEIFQMTIGTVSALIGGLFFLFLFFYSERSSCLPSTV